MPAKKKRRAGIPYGPRVESGPTVRTMLVLPKDEHARLVGIGKREGRTMRYLILKAIGRIR